ncbi:MAG TPA: hypothetical protein VE967_02355 [Gemmatimonadaceae bacterium]|nr:hypothetical protein [Gemmatimonadaceae bacterium]
MKASLRALVGHLVDYAGLFPPASLAMHDAVQNYAAYLEGSDAWMLGRFVVTDARLGEFAQEAEAPTRRARDPWRAAVVASGRVTEALASIAAFNAAHRNIVCDVVEVRASTREDVAHIAKACAAAPGVSAFVELPVSGMDLIEAVGAAGLAAKIRTGGTAPNAFPAAEEIANFIATCVRGGVAFKATAGLHHPLRGEYRLTYAPDSPRGAMYGYLNVFLAAALLHDGGSVEDACALLTESDPSAIVAGEDGVRWRGHLMLTARLAQLRSRAALSFGSCSFREPVDELASLPLAS